MTLNARDFLVFFLHAPNTNSYTFDFFDIVDLYITEYIMGINEN